MKSVASRAAFPGLGSDRARAPAGESGRAGPLRRVGRKQSVDSDRTTVGEAQAGSLEAFETLVRRYQVRIVNYTLAITRNMSDAEDITQETFIRAFRALRRFRGQSSFKTWLYTIATNTARAHMRATSRRGSLEGRSMHTDSTGNGADVIAAGVATVEDTLLKRDAIDRALGALPEQLRLAVVLRDVEGLDYREIADITGVPLGTVESRIFRARQRLRPLLAPLMGVRSGQAMHKEKTDDV